MKINEALISLEHSWSREEVLLKIKNGSDSERIINDFISSKQEEIKTLTNFINPQDNILLSEIEELSKIESQLINKIKNQSFNKEDSSLFKKNIQKSNLQSNKKNSFNLGLYMMKWGNKFVFISLLVLSAVALTKQAWA